MVELVCGDYVVKKNTNSVVRQHFELRATEKSIIVDKEQDKLVAMSNVVEVCKLREVTQHLFQHMREHHPMIYLEIAPKHQSKAQVLKLACLMISPSVLNIY